MVSDRATRLRRLARTITARFGLASDRQEAIEAEWSGSARAWVFSWTDGPTVAQVRAACGEAEPEASERLRYVRGLSQNSAALGAVRLTVSSATSTGRRPFVSAPDVEKSLRDEPFPAPRTERERALVYAVVYEIHDAHRRNQADAEEICGLINRYGLAMFLRRCGAELSPAEILTAHYAASHAHPTWRYQLAPMEADVLFRAVHEDLRAPAEIIAAALALLPELPAGFAEAEHELRVRLERATPTAQGASSPTAPGRRRESRATGSIQ
ncbi:hypothetical protein OHA98_24880 [Streptomyces sp. NBC_00654]|uniref:hypothetical protein n=1 Tax=Streptomyces sp. NBC_00654 TaxID=2975799 RepID=UPI0022525F50|nr:hypothetical protein [Streptomyces sp. NBC_00654]MCX4967938.1 hypothetical protein [Streptomyces sp. NBC_00654]